MKRIFSILLLLSAAFSLRAQEYNALWRQAPEGFISEYGQPALRPDHYKTFSTTESLLRDYLATASADPAAARQIDLPTPDGGYRSFRFWATPAMEKELADRFPGISTFTAEATDNRQVTAKLDYTPFGFHAMVFDGSRTYMIDPYTGTATGAYLSYYKRDYTRPLAQRMSCNNGDPDLPRPDETSLTGSGLPVLERVHGTVRRTYRLALAADSEYCRVVAGAFPTKANVLAKMVTTVNRVNGVYERELALTMVLVARNDTLIFLGSDPYSNNNGGAMLSQNQATVSARIGAGNYDIGHVFSTGGGGVAFQGCVCNNSYKAYGVTGSPNPVGDAFDIDFVSHEMGHQYGAGHTFNANTGSCNGNGVANLAYEPGSGSTIMAYAGICGGGNDYQAHSDAYFHSASLEEISGFISSPTGGGSCPATTASSNTTASVPGYAATYAIPFRTPFELTAPKANDATADLLTYCWEERDLGDFTRSLAQTRLAGPLFRSFPPDTARTRVFPTLPRLLVGSTSYNAEKLPDTNRTLTFRFTERDIYQGWGTFNFPDDAVTLNVIRTSAPFTVTTPNGSEIWTGGETRTITWDVAGTTAAPINAARVDIYVSMDGGYTYPYLAKAGTPNDGSEAIIMPNPFGGAPARVKVKGTGNVFFNISQEFYLEHTTVSVGQSPLADNITLSPVPARDVLRVNIPTALGTFRVRILNGLGQAVWSGDMNGQSSLAVGGWAPGLYHVRMHNDQGVQLSRKIVVE